MRGIRKKYCFEGFSAISNGVRSFVDLIMFPILSGHPPGFAVHGAAVLKQYFRQVLYCFRYVSCAGVFELLPASVAVEHTYGIDPEM